MTKHIQEPEREDLPDDVLERALGQVSSSYGQRPQLLNEINGKVVTRRIRVLKLHEMRNVHSWRR